MGGSLRRIEPWMEGEMAGRCACEWVADIQHVIATNEISAGEIAGEQLDVVLQLDNVV